MYPSFMVGLFTLILSLLYLLVLQINTAMLFHPIRLSEEELQVCLHHYQPFFIPCDFYSLDQKKLTGILYRYQQTPSFDDTVFLFSHGNGGNIVAYLEDPIIKMLSTHGSIFMYDYRGYGTSQGKPTEQGLYQDGIAAYQYLLTKTTPDKIILYGFSLGCAVTSHLMLQIEKQHLPRAMILQAPFSSLLNIARDLFQTTFSLLKYFVLYQFNNLEHLSLLQEKNNVFILHSQHDMLIPLSHAKDLVKLHDKYRFIEIQGIHNNPVFNDEVHDMLTSIISVNYVMRDPTVAPIKSAPLEK